ncbi:MAG: nucleotidyl transferase AbiEii/AbiGii toxin family protein [Mesorhizobium sp.]|uniref:nucleotidyl transferase AbiEii/AbiGii toxin family protein n=1 Tax=Mesorhizobium sp. TaxID=1871066 RepID=UPI000FE53A72|nr:nucleotidyl transferase AbiEii/AbiGii toxin family protein [Mesorhizobium sp.]RWM87454.1 MAG: nucleotidyl transferase AbiEii/AbiGii toxin family protein [Mesorhizobium sp.]
MIDPKEIDDRAEVMGVHVANVERDYVFGWLLKAFYENDFLAPRLIFKGGNAMRKAFYPNTRFSTDLDFSLESALDLDRASVEINRACEAAQAMCGVQFDTAKNTLKPDAFLDENRRSYKGSVYFQDFYGNAASVTIAVRVDLTEFDRIYLPTVMRPLIHAYSDAPECLAELRCMALEELLANKLKCLIQRRHSFDLYDLVYAAFFERSIEVDRRAVLSTFLKKTIFQASPASAKDILLGIPMPFFKAAWTKYVAPLAARLEFERAEEGFRAAVESIFEGVFPRGWSSTPFYPAQLRNLIMEAGSSRRLLALTYDGRERQVEPYALTYKRRKDGHAEEYFYVWDRTGGQTSGPGQKTLLHAKVRDMRILDEQFEPRFPIELAKAGQPSEKEHFGDGIVRTRARVPRKVSTRPQARPRKGPLWGGMSYTVQCPYCLKKFKRSTLTTALNPHKDSNGYPCASRHGYLV